MAEVSKIEWCDATVNFWWGCTKVSPGCANCYAEELDARFHGHHCTGRPMHWGANKPRKKIKGAVKLAMKLERRAAWEFEDAHACGRAAPRRPRVFCSSMADWLDSEVPVEWLAEMLDTIRLTPHLDWLLLTKRPKLWMERIVSVLRSIDNGLIPWQEREWLADWLSRSSYLRPHNVWIGTSVEDQKRADERIPALLKIPVRVRFLSCEPLLGPVDLAESAGIDWVICGGESGRNARPMHTDWARGLRDQCAAAGVPFLFKQWGEWASVSEVEGPGEIYEFPDGANVRRVGKKLAGRTLEHVEHNEFPEVNL